MVKKADTTPAEQGEKKVPRKQRTLEERIAELQAKAEAKKIKESERARAALVIALEQREKLEAKLANVNTSIDELRAAIGEVDSAETTVDDTTSTED